MLIVTNIWQKLSFCIYGAGVSKPENSTLGFGYADPLVAASLEMLEQWDGQRERPS
jgi:hypothetical protein